jgi:hypothetical protein
MITDDSLDWNIIDHHLSRMPQPIVWDGKQTNIHTSDKPRELITGLGCFCSELPTTNEQLANN